MTIYLHFTDGTQAVRLHNVEAVEDAGPRSVRVRLLFAGEPTTYTAVRRVAVETDAPDDDE